MTADQGRCEECKERTLNGRCRNRECKLFKKRGKIHVLSGGVGSSVQVLLQTLAPSASSSTRVTAVAPGGASGGDNSPTSPTELSDGNDATQEQIGLVPFFNATATSTMQVTLNFPFDDITASFSKIDFVRLKARVRGVLEGGLAATNESGTIAFRNNTSGTGGQVMTFDSNWSEFTHDFLLMSGGAPWTRSGLNAAAFGYFMQINQSGGSNPFWSQQVTAECSELIAEAWGKK